MSYKNRVYKALKGIGSKFSRRHGELAYLAVTSKIERPLRDKLAFQLHKLLKPKRRLVSREWGQKRRGRKKHFDLAILSADGTAEVIIEIKAMGSPNAFKPKQIEKYSNKMRKDIKKCTEQFTDGKTKIFAILFATHPTSKFPGHLKGKGVVKSFVRFNSMNSRQKNSQMTAQKNVLERLRKNFLSQNVKSGIIRGGNAFGVKTNVIFWVIGPFAR